MTNRYHLPVVVTTSDELSRDEVADYVERVLANLEETDAIYRTYVEGSNIEEGEAERLLDMLETMDDGSLVDAIDAIEHISKEDDE